MTIKEIYDEINDVTVTMVEGTVQQISFKEIPGGSDKFGNTHRAGIRVDDDWVNNVNIKVNEGFDPQVRFNAGTKVSPKYETLEAGDVVKIVVQPSDYNGKTYYNSGVSKIRLVKKGSGSPQQPQGGSQKAYTPQKRDNSGIVAGNGFNAAKALLGTYEDTEEFVNTAIALVDIGQKLRNRLKESRPDLDEYSVGAQSGMALIAACEWADNIDDVENIAMDILDNALPKITEYVKSLDEPKKVVKKTVAKKTVAKKTTKKVEPSPDPVDDEDIPDSAFLDDEDSLPF